jgi:hypothetical protein
MGSAVRIRRCPATVMVDEIPVKPLSAVLRMGRLED